ncbi:hypothetical protein GW796_08155 [archaeon]|nr:hypothetical protein [archaeon]
MLPPLFGIINKINNVKQLKNEKNEIHSEDKIFHTLPPSINNRITIIREFCSNLKENNNKNKNKKL